MKPFRGFNKHKKVWQMNRIQFLRLKAMLMAMMTNYHNLQIWRTYTVPVDSSAADPNLTRWFFPDGEVLEDDGGRRCGDDVGAL